MEPPIGVGVVPGWSIWISSAGGFFTAGCGTRIVGSANIRSRLRRGWVDGGLDPHCRLFLSELSRSTRARCVAYVDEAETGRTSRILVRHTRRVCPPVMTPPGTARARHGRAATVKARAARRVTTSRATVHGRGRPPSGSQANSPRPTGRGRAPCSPASHPARCPTRRA